MLEFLKALVEKLRIDLLLASLAFAILLFKLCGFDAWWMIFVFCLTYIAILGIEKLLRCIRKKRESKRQNLVKAANARQEEEDLNNEVWKRFYALDSQTLGLLKKIYLAEEDPANPLIRYVHDGGALAFEIDRSYDFKIPAGNRVYCPLLYAEHLAQASVITFHPYYMKLVARFVETGRRERV